MTTTWSLTPFFNELDILEIRLGELDDVVDVHVIAEANVTFKGDAKPMHLRDHWDRFSPWHHKIRYVPVEDMPGDVLGTPDPLPGWDLTAVNSDRWARENHQRQALARGLLFDGPEPFDLVLLSDVDEIPFPSAFDSARALLNNQHERVVCPPLALHMYHLDWRWLMPAYVIARFCTGSTMLTHGPQGIRNWTQNGHELTRFGPAGRGPGLGWHLSYLGGVKAIQYKLAQAAHHEVDRPPFNTAEWIAECLETGRDLFDRQRPLVEVPWSELPAYIQRHPARYRHLFSEAELPTYSEADLNQLEASWRW